MGWLVWLIVVLVVLVVLVVGLFLVQARRRAGGVITTRGRGGRGGGSGRLS